MTLIELTKTLIENIGGILASITGLVVAITGFIKGRQYLKKKEVEKKEQSDTQKAILSIKNKEIINRLLDELCHQYECTFSHVLRFHNGGTRINPMSPLFVTMEFESVKYKGLLGDKGKTKKQDWDKGVPLDENFNHVLSSIALDANYHVQDLTLQPENKGLRLMYNRLSGKEIYMIEIGWINNGKSLLVLSLQREDNNKLIKDKQKYLLAGHINSKALEIKKLIESTL